MDRALMRTAEKGEGLEVTASFLRSNADHKWRALSFERESGIGRDRLWRGWDIEICFQWVEVELSRGDDFPQAEEFRVGRCPRRR